MRQISPNLPPKAHSLSVLCIGLVACAMGPAKAPPAPPAAPSEGREERGASPAADIALKAAGPVGGGAAPGAAAATPLAGEAPAPPREGAMLDIEAHFAIEVNRVVDAGDRLRDLVRHYRGLVIEDVLSGTDLRGTERLTIRVASGNADAFFHAIEALGKLRSKQVSAKDVGKAYYDAELQLRNLEAAMKRYEQILALAKDVKETMTVEQELTRIRGQIEEVKGNLRYLADRAAKATIHVTLEATHPEEVESPTAKLFPGLRLGGAWDLRGGGKDAGYLGVGLSMRFSRAFSVDLDGYKDASKGGGGLDLFLLTAGGELYSEFFHDGKRKWMNPYLGFRAGWSHLLGFDEMALGGTAGVEILKTPEFYLDAQVRGYALFANPHVPAHALLQPTLAAHFSF